MATATTDKWDRRFLEMAKLVSTWSYDPSTQVGAVIAKGKKFISSGYNGFPQGVKDCPKRYKNRDLKLRMIIHSEVNAILFANRKLKGCTLYTYPFLTCSRCAAMVIQKKIKRVVAPYSDNPRWLDDFAIASAMFAEAGVEVSILDGTPDFISYNWGKAPLDTHASEA